MAIFYSYVTLPEGISLELASALVSNAVSKAWHLCSTQVAGCRHPEDSAQVIHRCYFFRPVLTFLWDVYSDVHWFWDICFISASCLLHVCLVSLYPSVVMLRSTPRFLSHILSQWSSPGWSDAYKWHWVEIGLGADLRCGSGRFEGPGSADLGHIWTFASLFAIVW